jgi:amino-acid N-acetyltransferase
MKRDNLAHAFGPPRPAASRFALSRITVRPARAWEQEAIRRLVLSERLNPTDLRWHNFIVAVDDSVLVGAVQLRRHADGSRELGSLVVLPQVRGQGIAARLIDTLLADQRGQVHMITNGEHAERFRQWGFERIEPRRAPWHVRRNHLFGRLARVISFFKGRPPVRLVILERAAR